MKIAASQNVGRLAARNGPAMEAYVAPLDALRSVVGWFLLIAVVAARRANRARTGCALLLAPLCVWIAAGVGEALLNRYLVFHYHQYLCSITADFLRFFSLSLAVVLAVADLLIVPWKWVRWVIVACALLFLNHLQVRLNAWPMLSHERWVLIFGQVLLVFLAGQSVARALLQRWVKSERLPAFYGWFCLALGVVPLALLGGVEWKLSRLMPLQSTQETYRMVVVLTAAATLPWFVFSWFVLLARWSAAWGERFERAFGKLGPGE